MKLCTTQHQPGKLIMHCGLHRQSAAQWQHGNGGTCSGNGSGSRLGRHMRLTHLHDCAGMPAARRCVPVAAAGQASSVPLIDPLAGPSELPLWGKRIMVAGPRQYAGRLAAPLAAAGARVVSLPCIAIRRLDDDALLQDLDAALFSLDSFQHIAFTSRNAVAGALSRLAALHATSGFSGSSSGGSAPHSDADGSRSRGGSGGSSGSVADFMGKAAAALNSCGARLWALGADARALRDAGVDNVSVPDESSTQGLAAALAASGCSGERVLCLVPHVSPPLVEPPVVPRFLAALEQAGAEPVRAPAYLTGVGFAPTDCLVERDMLEHGAISAIAFSSQAEAQGLLQAMGGDVAQLANIVQMHGVLLAAHGPYTAAGVTETLGLPVECVSKDFSSFDGLVAALSVHFSDTGAGA